MNLLFTLVLVVIAAAGVLFYAKFTRYGAVDFRTAWTHATLWGSAVLGVFGPFVAELIAWLASIWEPLQQRAGGLLANPTFGEALQLIGLFFFLLKAKGQTFPKLPRIPSPDETAAPAG